MDNGMTLQEKIAHAQGVKQKYEAELLKKRNVVGVGIGFRFTLGKLTGQVAIVVNVRQKVTATALNVDDLIPATLDGVPVDVVEVGTIRAQ